MLVCLKPYSNFSTATYAPRYAAYGPGTGSIVFASVACVGGETRLVDCPVQYTHSCNHWEDAGVRCEGELNHIHPISKPMKCQSDYFYRQTVPVLANI